MAAELRSQISLRKWWFRAAIVFGILALLQYSAGLYLSARARDQLVRLLRERYQGRVDLRSVTVTLFPTPRAVGEELNIWPKERTALLPLISVRSLNQSLHASANRQSLRMAVSFENRA